MILHLGIIKSDKNKGMYHCNSFLTTYQSDREKDVFFCHLAHRYEISKIVREDKQTKKKETIYQSEEAALREMEGVRKMLAASQLESDEKLLKAIIRMNVKFGIYHTIEMLQDTDALLKKCQDKREEALVKDYLKQAFTSGIL